ncbi:MAG: aldo/keto reductase [Planctomycetota bacterium]|nr:aldo/keto reductase [Planctomycetota bacterium]
MQYVTLGGTDLKVSRVAFGAGPIPQLMTEDAGQLQRATVEQALDSGVNWFDTAATYGMGKSEESLGATLADLAALERVHLATKVRLMPADLDDIAGNVEASVMGSLSRLRVQRLTLLQLHNSVTAGRGDEATSLTSQDVIGPGGVLETLERLRSRGVVEHLGLTGIGQPDALREVIASGRFATMQVPYNLLNSSAGSVASETFPETDYGNVIDAAAAQRMGVFAIRVYAGGALVGQPPAPHTFKTKFFPLDLFQRDSDRAAQLTELLDTGASLADAGLRYVLGHPQIQAAIVGFSSPSQVRQAVDSLLAGPLPELLYGQLAAAGQNPPSGEGSFRP